MQFQRGWGAMRFKMCEIIGQWEVYEVLKKVLVNPVSDAEAGSTLVGQQFVLAMPQGGIMVGSQNSDEETISNWESAQLQDGTLLVIKIFVAGDGVSFTRPKIQINMSETDEFPDELLREMLRFANVCWIERTAGLNIRMQERAQIEQWCSEFDAEVRASNGRKVRLKSGFKNRPPADKFASLQEVSAEDFEILVDEDQGDEIVSTVTPIQQGLLQRLGRLSDTPVSDVTVDEVEITQDVPNTGPDGTKIVKIRTS
jgi:hypothetical protein